MSDLVVVVPSRGRPDAAKNLAAVFEETRTGDSELVFAVDRDDPDLDGYRDLPTLAGAAASMVEALNQAVWALVHQAASPPFAVGFMGDDHRPCSVGWDRRYLDALRELGTGIVYGDDLLQGRRLPTQCAMTSDIVNVLGYMAPPALGHLYVDTFWRDLGQAAGCLTYLPDVVVEHQHPIAGKADWDAGYRRVNSDAQYAADRYAYQAFKRSVFDADVAKVRALRLG